MELNSGCKMHYIPKSLSITRFVGYFEFQQYIGNFSQLEAQNLLS